MTIEPAIPANLSAINYPKGKEKSARGMSKKHPRNMKSQG